MRKLRIPRHGPQRSTRPVACSLDSPRWWRGKAAVSADSWDRSKPAWIPLGRQVNRLIDIPISNCINSGLKKIFVLTQFNSASLNHHVTNSYRFDPFGEGSIEVLAAEQTVSNLNWFQGTADSVLPASPHITSRAETTISSSSLPAISCIA